jgi:hypothetical protein
MYMGLVIHYIIFLFGVYILFLYCIRRKGPRYYSIRKI